MTDVVSKSVRSAIMSKIKSKNTKCEKTLCKDLKRVGLIGFKTHYDVIGTPDIAFPREKLAIFCDSDFWHGKKEVPKTNSNYWIKKFKRNRNRDRLVNRELKKIGWTIIRISEQNILKNPDYQTKRIKKVLEQS